MAGGSLKLSQHTSAALFPALEAQLETKDDVRRPLTLLDSQGVQLLSGLAVVRHTTAALPHHGHVMGPAGAERKKLRGRLHNTRCPSASKLLLCPGSTAAGMVSC